MVPCFKRKRLNILSHCVLVSETYRVYPLQSDVCLFERKRLNNLCPIKNVFFVYPIKKWCLFQSDVCVSPFLCISYKKVVFICLKENVWRPIKIVFCVYPMKRNVFCIYPIKKRYLIVWKKTSEYIVSPNSKRILHKSVKGWC